MVVGACFPCSAIKLGAKVKGLPASKLVLYTSTQQLVV
jgi:hypothetical protein